MRFVLTGGSRGFGKALADELKGRGHEVVSGSRGNGPYSCDVRIEKSVKSLADRAIRDIGGIDVWINNAGFSMDDGVCDERWSSLAESVLLTNVLGTMHGTRTAKDRDAKHVFNVYGAGHDGNAVYSKGHVVYSASKAAVSFYTRAEALNGEVPVHGIIPGLMKTDMFDMQIEHLPHHTHWLLTKLSVDPSYIAEIAADEIERIVSANGDGEVIDCYGKGLFKKFRELFRRD